jgi:hypothetical protein
MLVGSPISSDRTVTTPLDPATAHRRLHDALLAKGYDHVSDGDSGDLTAEHGNRNLFRFAGVSETVELATVFFAKADTYPISVDVAFQPAGSGTEVAVHAESYKPPGFITNPKHGPEATKWRQACDAAVTLIVDALHD